MLICSPYCNERINEVIVKDISTWYVTMHLQTFPMNLKGEYLFS